MPLLAGMSAKRAKTVTAGWQCGRHAFVRYGIHRASSFYRREAILNEKCERDLKNGSGRCCFRLPSPAFRCCARDACHPKRARRGCLRLSPLHALSPLSLTTIRLLSCVCVCRNENEARKKGRPEYILLVQWGGGEEMERGRESDPSWRMDAMSRC